MEQNQLAQFNKQSYLNLETTRKSGQAVATPVWFVQEGERLYVRTQDGSGKVKRIRNNPDVRVMLCGVRGEPKGEWVAARASFADEAGARRANQLLNKKYGLVKLLFELQSKLSKTVYTVIVIE